MSNPGTWKLTPLTPCSVARVVKELDAAFERENLNVVKQKQKSPAEQFDESHAKWAEAGREC